MAYPVIASNKIQYDKDGSVVTRCDNTYAYKDTVTDANVVKLNSNIVQSSVTNNNQHGIIIYFPKLRNITHMYIGGFANYVPEQFELIELQGSADTTNGIDGTWINYTGTNPVKANPGATDWRTMFKQVSFGTPVKAIRVRVNSVYSYTENWSNIHVYGSDAVDDGLIVTDSGGNKITSLVEFGDTKRNSVFNNTIYIKNASALSASGITVDIEGTAYTSSLDNSTFDVAQKSLGALAAGAISAPIYVRFAPTAETPLGASSGRILVNGTLS